MEEMLRRVLLDDSAGFNREHQQRGEGENDGKKKTGIWWLVVKGMCQHMNRVE